MTDAETSPPLRRLDRVFSLVVERPLLVMPHAAENVFNAIQAGLSRGTWAPAAQTWGARSDAEGDGSPPPYTIQNGIATIAVHGELANRGSWLNAASGITSYEAIGSALRQARADSRVRGILLDIDSPGGEAAGAMETADLVREVSASKKTVAFVNSLAASAAFAIAAGASKIVVTPSGTVGSIGVVWLHLDRSDQMTQRGIKPTFLHSGEYKVDGNSMQRLEAGPRGRIQASIDDVYNLFVASVGKHRPQLGEAGARKTEAATFIGAKAVAAKLADSVGTIETALAFLAPSTSMATFTPRSESFMSQPSLVASPSAVPPVVAPVSTQADVNATWRDTVDTINRQKGLVSPSRAAVPDPNRSTPAPNPAVATAPGASAASTKREAARRAANELAARQGLGTQADIDASWAETAARLNARK